MNSPSVILVLDGARAYQQYVAARRFPRLRAASTVVLIIADDPVAREVYCELFLMRGHQVMTAAGARDGLRLARDRRINVVVLAVPSGAAQLRRKLHALRPMLRVHVTGLNALPFDILSSMPRQQLH